MHLNFSIGDIVRYYDHLFGIVVLIDEARFTVEWFDGGYYDFPTPSYYHANLKRVSS